MKDVYMYLCILKIIWYLQFTKPTNLIHEYQKFDIKFNLRVKY